MSGQVINLALQSLFIGDGLDVSVGVLSITPAGNSSIAATNSGVSLVGDVANPGANEYYGTNAAATKGWYQVSGAGSYGAGTGIYINSNGNINVDNTVAPINSPQFAGIPGAPTPSRGSDNGQIATTFFVTDALGVLSGSLLSTAAPMATGSSGTAGTMAYDTGFFYVCIGTNIWRRAILSSW